LNISSSQLNLENTLVNGQCFNWSKISDDKYKGIYRQHLIVLERLDDQRVQFMSAPPLHEDLHSKFMKEYLQIYDVDLDKFYADWSERDPKYFAEMAVGLPGVRCLRQDPWDCTISFICSSNNNIKRITQLVGALRTNYGSKIDIPKEIQVELGSDEEYTHAFPSLEEMEKATEAQLRDAGFGYRAGYIVASVKLIKKNGGVEWLEGLRKEKDDVKVRESLITLKGVGRKVADCVALFSMDCPNVIPVDTHVFQIAQRFGFIKGGKSQASLNAKMHQDIQDAFIRVYGPYAGWAHQILFAGDLAQFQ